MSGEQGGESGEPGAKKPGDQDGQNIEGLHNQNGWVIQGRAASGKIIQYLDGGVQNRQGLGVREWG